ncbi:hypothetical protein NEIMUCOT_04410 [Neisseria mucosa ATCC 25996]|uniref:Uncharacterized protein n=1 Tax=Neisseria mucosa (strain ATCC 25996 / DSM 4631 / NCTC 10774 / M26) TaxID=546266 RepID=D2ZUW9_NEIM2|nr:hypothetical protein NEIMUCOT_04410 [Neisseria mucosa ATCC 25996]
MSKSKFFRGVLWYFCQAVKYGQIVTPAITRRLMGWCLPYFSSRPILVGVVICLHPYWCLLYFSNRPILSFGRLLCVSALSVMRPNKKAYIDKKVVVTVVTVLPNPYKSGLSR